MTKMFFHEHAKQYCFYPTINGKRTMFYLGKDEAEAKIEYHTLKLEHQKNPLSKKNLANMPFNWLADQFLGDDYMQHEISRIAYRDYEHSLSTFCTMFPDIKTNEINSDIIKKYRRYLLTKKYQGTIRSKHGVSLSRAKKHLMYLKRVLNWAIEEEKLKPSDIAFPKPKREVIPRKLPVYLSDKEIKLLLTYKNNLPKYCNNKARKNILRTIQISKFILSSGRRIQEVVNLKKKNFDFNAKPKTYQVVKHKTEKADPDPKVFPISKEAYDIVRPITDRINDDDYIFPDDSGGRLKISSLSQCFRKILKTLSIQHISFKELRHTFASHMLMNKVPLEALKELLGHASIKSTEVYAHVTKDYLKQEIDNPGYNKLLKDDTITM